ncbi:DegT/DnrJ/EryC1/StrS aminotransferase family protein [Kamptonema cortianum]|nr:DegT/DnrJ/EryC1/StrS aminotransferase family protein [Geitlerinema splendidum]MDK3155264.1 DegT/DnrJ/EryC1/StrS aminotransferase family protein [Kamptonema cortianum]
MSANPTTTDIGTSMEEGKWPTFSPEEIQAVAKVLESGKVNYWTGTEGREFEAEFASYIGAGKAIAMANGTVTLEACLKALGIGPGDEVVVTPRSFVASASCVLSVGATPIFADVDIDSGNITAQSIDAVLTSKTKAVIPVHLAGWPCDMKEIMELAEERNLKVIEDAAQAHGAEIGGRKVGSFGHANSFSFCQDKIMTTAGEGGMVTTSDEDLWNQMWSLKDHGKSYDAVFKQNHPPGFRWLHESLGTNWRMTEVQSAVGRIQLRNLASWVQTRRKNAQILIEHLSDIDCLRVPVPKSDLTHAYYKFYCYLNPEVLGAGWNQQRVIHELSQAGVTVFSGSCSEIYLEKVFQQAGIGPPTRLPIARKLGETSLMFLVHPTLSESVMIRTGETVRRVLQQAKK